MVELDLSHFKESVQIPREFTKEVIYLIERPTKCYKDMNKDSHMIFVSYKRLVTK